VPLPNQAEEEVLSSDVSVTEFVGGCDRLIEDYSGARGVRQVANSIRASGLASRHSLLDGLLEEHWVRPEVLDDVHHQRILFAKQAEQKVLGAYLVMVLALGFFARLYQGTAHPVREIVATQLSVSSSSPKDFVAGRLSQGQVWRSYLYFRKDLRWNHQGDSRW
jgi:hypothetical protein